MPIWTPLHLHSHYSILDGLSKPNQITEVCRNYGYDACALTDHGSISGTIKFIQACKGDQKKGEVSIKPILGNEFYISGLDANIKSADNDMTNTSHLVVLAKNLRGWKNLIQATSRSNEPELFYYKPRLDLNKLAEYANGDLISFSGHPGSELANALFKGRDAYGAETYEEAQALLLPNALDIATQLALKYQDIFGKGNFFLEIQLIDSDRMSSTKLIADILREVSKRTGIPTLATADSHYPNRVDADDQRVLLCSGLGLTLREVRARQIKGEKVPLDGFFRSNNFHIPSPEEMQALHKDFPHELENSNLIASMCDKYDVLGKPQIPDFPELNGKTSSEYLRELCRIGWRSKLEGKKVFKDADDRQRYADRVKYELSVIEKANLDGYFLIVQDYVNWAKKQGWLLGAGRGSGGGSLVSYLTGIIGVNPLETNLLFERFYNEGRNTEDHIALPDIDVDFPVFKREELIAYIRDKYGRERVGQMSTFAVLQGRGAIKEVLRIHDAVSNDVMNSISRNIPEKQEIADQLEDAKETSILRWTLMNDPEALQDWCRMDDDGTLSGELAQYFEQAIRLEGTIKGSSKHASGLVIANDAMANLCPMIRDGNTNERIAGFEMNDLEAIGGVKFDILGVAILDKLMGANNLLSKGSIE